MHLVLIHWKIIRTEQAVQDFLRYWSDVLTIPDRGGLLGEFLSRPMQPEETGLFHNGVALHDTPAYYSFINIGLWEDVRAFQEQIDRPYRQRGLSKLPFEYAHNALRADFGPINPGLRDQLAAQLRHTCPV